MGEHHLRQPYAADEQRAARWRDAFASLLPARNSLVPAVPIAAERQLLPRTAHIARYAGRAHQPAGRKPYRLKGALTSMPFDEFQVVTRNLPPSTPAPVAAELHHEAGGKQGSRVQASYFIRTTAFELGLHPKMAAANRPPNPATGVEYPNCSSCSDKPAP